MPAARSACPSVSVPIFLAVLPGYLLELPPLVGIALAGMGKDREGEMTSPYPILSILGIVIVALTHRGLSDLGRATIACPLAGPLRTEPRRTLRFASGRG